MGLFPRRQSTQQHSNFQGCIWSSEGHWCQGTGRGACVMPEPREGLAHVHEYSHPRFLPDPPSKVCKWLSNSKRREADCNSPNFHCTAHPQTPHRHTHWMKDGTQNVLVVAALQNDLNISLKQSRLSEKFGFCCKRLWCFTAISFPSKSRALKQKDEEWRVRHKAQKWGPRPLTLL